MKRIGNLYSRIYDFENLYAAYLEARKGKRYRDEVLRYTANLEENLIQIQNELIHHTYKVGKYRQFYVTEPKKRLVMALPFKDRVVQWAIYRVLNPIFDKTFIPHSYGCRVGKGSHAAAAKLQYWLRLVSKKPGKWYYLKLDIAKYFYRVDHVILLEILKDKLKDQEVVNLLATIIQSEGTKFGLPITVNLDCDTLISEKGMPIGNLTSQMFANIYLNELDYHIKHDLQLHYYVRYMDDMIILHHDKGQLHHVKSSIEEFLLTKLKLNLNNKTAIRPISLGIHFVGYQIWNSHKTIRKPTALKIKRKLRKMAAEYNKGMITLNKLKASLASYMGMLIHANCNRFRSALLKNLTLCKSDERG